MRDPTVGRRIRQVRERLNLTQAEFGKRLGTIKVSVTRYEAGRLPRADLLDRIARMGGVTVEWLLHGDRSAAASQSPESALARRDVSQEFLCLLNPDQALERLSHLPARYRERYRGRIKEIAARIQRELDEYRRVLEAEYRAERAGKRTTGQTRPKRK